MVRFGRKFFFEKVYKKRNYTLPLIIGGVLLIAIVLIFSTTAIYKLIKQKSLEPKIELKKAINVEINSQLPGIEKYIKEIKNLSYDDLKIIYPDNLEITLDNSNCTDEENQSLCTNTKVLNTGTFNIIIKVNKLKDKELKTKLIVKDTQNPQLSIKEYTITEGDSYDITNFVESCVDNSNKPCIYKYDTLEEGSYENISGVGTHTIKLYAEDETGNKSDVFETTLTINEKKVETKKEGKKDNNTISCKYGNLSYSNSYILAARIEGNCAISKEEAEDLTNTAGIKFNKLLAKEIQDNYLQNTLTQMGIEGQLTVDVTYGPVLNKTKKGVVGYFIMEEAKQTINGVTTTIERFYLDESGNRIWKINTFNLK